MRRDEKHAPRFRRALPLGMLATALSIGACLHAQRGASRTAIDTAHAQLDTAAILPSARSDIDAANAAWVPGMKRHDAAMIAAAYADSALFIAGNGSVTRGRAAIARLYAARFPHLRTILDGAVVQDGLTVLAPTRIVEWGHAWIDQEPASGAGPPVRTGAPYLTVWTRGKDAHWRIARNLTF